MSLADEITALRSAIRKGVTRVRYDGHEVEYRSLSEMRSILREMMKESGEITGDGVSYPDFTKGTCE